MKKGGFTLLELLAVVVIVAVVGVSATLAFTNIEDETAEEELKNIYIEIQRAANLYLDLHSSDLESFMQVRVMDFRVDELRSENYVDSDLENPVNHEPINGEYYVRLYIKDDESAVGSCIIDRKPDGDVCIANDRGLPEHCCE